MKKLLLLFALLSGVTGQFLFAQCTSAGQGKFPSTNVPLNTDCTPKVITTLAYTDEYSVVTGASAQTYEFKSSVSGDFITIADDATNTAIAWGTTPLTYTFGTPPGDLRVYRHDDNTCPISSETSRTITVTCTGCSAPALTCSNPSTPANNATGVSITPTLTWPAITNAEKYKLYISDALTDCSSTPTYTLLTTTSNLSYTIPGVGALMYNKSYKWYYAPVGCDGVELTGCDATNFFCFTTISGPPANDDCSAATSLTVNPDLACGTSTTANTAGATQTSGEYTPTCNPSGIDDDIWYKFVATAAKHQLRLSSPSTSMTVSVASGACGTLTQLSGGCVTVTSGTNNYNLTGLTIGDTYFIRVYTTNTSVDGTLTLCIGTPPIIPADDCSNPIDLDSQISPLSSTTVGAANDFNISCISNTAPDLIYTTNVPDNYVLHIGQTVNAYDSRNYIGYSGTCPGATQIACYDDADELKTKWLNSTGSSQLVYFVQDGYSSGSGTFTLAWLKSPRETNDECSGAITVALSPSSACSYTTYSTSGGTKSTTPAPGCTTTDNDEDVWFSFTTTSAGAYNIRYNNLTATFGTTSTMGIDLYTGSCGALTPVGGACNNALGSGGSGIATVTLAASTTYTLRMWITGNTTQTAYGVGTFGLCIEEPSSCPMPSALTTSMITSSGAQLDWTENGSATNWDISYGVAPLTDPNSGTIINTSSKPYSLSGLSPDVTYDFYVRAVCGGSPGPWSVKASFKTLIDCASGPVLTCGTPVTSGNLAVAGGIWTSYPGGCAFTCNGKEKVYRFTPTVTATYTLNITSVNGGSGYIDYHYKVAGSCDNTGWSCIGDKSSTGTTNFGPLTAGTEYYILLDAESASSTANHTFQINCIPDMAYVSSTVGAQTTSSIGAGSVDASIVRLDVVVSGQANPLAVTSITCSTNGSTSPVTNNTSTAKIYYTGTSSSFSTATLFGSVAITADGSFTITGTQNLTGGASNTTNYFWLAYDVKCSAVNGNLLDGEFNSVTVGGSAKTPTAQSFAGNRSITALSSYDTKANGNFSDPNTWACGVPVSGGTIPVNINHNVALDQDFSANANLTVAAGKTFTISKYLTFNPLTSSITTTVNGTITLSGTGTFNLGSSLPGATGATLTIASGGNLNINTGGTLNFATANGTTSSPFNVNGTVTLGGGSVNVGPNNGFNRLMTVNSGGVFTVSGGVWEQNGSITISGSMNMSGGTLNIDPNSGTSGTSSTSSNSGLYLLSSTLNITGGAINFKDPMFPTSSRILNYSTSGDANIGAGCTVTFGTNTGGNHGNTAATGFYIECNTSTGTLLIQNGIVNGGPYAATNSRHASTNTSAIYITKFKNLTVNSGAEFVVNSAVLAITGDLVLNGNMTVTSTTVDRGLAFVGDAQYSGGVVLSAGSAAQSLTGSGFFRKSTSDAFPGTQAGNLCSAFSVWQTSGGSGFTLGMPLTVTSQLKLYGGRVMTTGTNLLTLGTSASTLGTLYTNNTGGTSPTNIQNANVGGWVDGPFKRWFSGATTDGTQAGILPVGSSNAPTYAQIVFTASPGSGTLTAFFQPGAPGDAGLPLTDAGGTGIYCNPGAISSTGAITIDKGNGLGAGTYTARFNYSNYSGLTGPNHVRVLKRPSGGGDWVLEGTHVAPSNNLSSRTGMSDFSTFAQIYGSTTALPVELTKFSGTARNKTNILSWETASEFNSDHFVLQRSATTDSESFEALGTVKAAGQSLQTNTYQFTDEQPLPVSYYRLKAVDFDGSFEYSKIIVLKNNDVQNDHVSVYPVPAHHAVNFVIQSTQDDDVLISITDLSGKVVRQQKLTVEKGTNNHEVNIDDLPAGMYQAIITGTAINSNLRIIKH